MEYKDKDELKQILKQIPDDWWPKIKKSRLADVGCGRGELLNLLNCEFKISKERLYGFDKQRQNVKISKKQFNQVFLKNFDKKIKFNQQFGAVFCLDVIEHTRQLKIFLNNLKAILIDGGFLVLTTPNYNSLSRKVLGKNWFGFKDKSHVCFFDKKKLTKELEKVGFKVEWIKTLSNSRFKLLNWILSLFGLGGQLIVGAKKINQAVSLISLGDGNSELLSTKINFYLKWGLEVRMVCADYKIKEFRKFIEKDIEFVGIMNCKKSRTKLGYLIELIKRNLKALIRIKEICRGTGVFYSVSSVTDELLIPWLVKLFKPEIKWVVLFENEVSFNKEGFLIVRLLAVWFYWLSLKMIKRADNVLTISLELKKVLISKGIDKEKIVVTGNAVDSQMIKKSLKLFGKEKKTEMGLFIGRIDVNKGVFDLIPIVKRIVEQKPKFKLLIVGSGSKQCEERLKQKIKEAGLSKKIILKGYMDGMKKYKLLAEAAVFLFPSKQESFGVAILEAVCTGLMVVAYDLKPFRKLYKNGEVNLIKLNDIDMFVDEIIKILDKKNMINYAGLNLLDSKWFNYERIAKMEYEIFNNS